MKKFLSIVAVLAIVFALAVPSFAATPSITAGEGITGEVFGDASLEPGTKVEVSKAEMSPAEEESLPAAVEKAAGEDASVVEVVDVELVDANGDPVSETYFDGEKTLTVAFARSDKTTKVVAVLCWNAKTGAWDEIKDFEIDENGNVIVTFSHLCTVAFVLEDVKAGPDAPGGNEPEKTPDGSGKKDPSKSQQTGYNTALWVAAAVVLVLGAGYCFVSARKKAAE